MQAPMDMGKESRMLSADSTCTCYVRKLRASHSSTTYALFLKAASPTCEVVRDNRQDPNDPAQVGRGILENWVLFRTLVAFWIIARV